MTVQKFSGICQHCHKKKVNRPCGLCWSCYHAPGVRQRHSGDKSPGYGIGKLSTERPKPILAGPGTPQRINELSRRAKACQPLHDAADAGWEANAGIDVDEEKFVQTSLRRRRARR